MSDTPKTDKHLSKNLWSGGRSEPGIYEFARELERENAELKQRLTTACDRIRDMLEGDDGQAWKEARTFLRRIGEPESIAAKKGGEQ
jgi:hypothetical protein